MSGRYTYDEILPLVEAHGIRRGRPPGQVWFHCPVHEDHNPSCTLSPRYGLVCQSNHCKSMDIARALGWKGGDDDGHSNGHLNGTYRNGHSRQSVPTTRQTRPSTRPPDQESGRDKGPPPIWVTRPADREFIYVDETGKPVAIHGRWELGDDKTFGWRLPDSKTEPGWDCGYRHGLGGLAEEHLPLYHLDELLAATEGSDCYVIEGEKACDVARANGLLATTLGGGSTQRRLGKHVLDPLKRFRRIFWPDQDATGWALMNWLAQQTKAFPHEQHLLRVPGAAPKHDAHDWFVVRKGTVEVLKKSLEGIITEPTSEYLGDDACRIYLPASTGHKVVVEAWGIEKTSRRELNAEISINLDGPGALPYPYSIRFNFLSDSARTSINRSLKDFFPSATVPDKEWPQLINTAGVHIGRQFTAKAHGQDLADLPRMTRVQYHLTPLFPWKQHTVVFGHGAGAKSISVEAMVLCMSLGYPWADSFDQMVAGPWGWVDYEDNDDGATFRYRAERILNGLYLTEIPRNLVHFVSAEGVPIVDLLPELRAKTIEHGLVGWVIDSAMPACGGDPLNTPAAQAYFDACSKLHTTVVTLAHVTKGAVTGGNKADLAAANLMPYGVATWELRARRTWNVQAHQPDDSSVATVKWFNRKKNARGAKPFGFRVNFGDPDGLITFEHDDAILEQRNEDDDAVALNNIELLLTKHIAPMTIKEICAASGYSDSTVRRSLKDSRFDTVRDGARGVEKLYTVATTRVTTETQPELDELPFG